ncbi:hypothetical protein SAMN05421504_103977 [Amycolatopsis xylanica]|uniref:Uncharacterized protein n=1 Tax=Amycolatopsis xylanica TaxID=589385 RepID=A0A1H3ETL6_9PSEU|nr:hypothetical protein SAMN05421504_103977 [Amycolatopsis xylanica]
MLVEEDEDEPLFEEVLFDSVFAGAAAVVEADFESRESVR